MAVQLNVTTTATFADNEAAEEFLLGTGGFEPHEIVSLLEGDTVEKTAEDPNELCTRPTVNKFHITEVENDEPTTA